LRIEFDLVNTGTRSGAKLPKSTCAAARPKQVLRAFRRVSLDAGGKAHVSVELTIADLAHYDAKSARNVVDLGRSKSA